MMWYRLSGLLLALQSLSAWAAPPADTVVVTGIEQVVRLSPVVRSALTEASFPDYLAGRPDLQKTVREALAAALQRRWPGSILVWRLPPGNWLHLRPVAVAPAIDRNRGSGTQYVAVQQVVQLATTAADTSGMPLKHFLSTTTVWVQDAAGTPVHTGKAVLPFSTANRPGQLAGLAETAPADWAGMLAVSVGAAMDAPASRLPARALLRPAPDMAAYGLATPAPDLWTVRETEPGGGYRGGNRERTLTVRTPAGTLQQWRGRQNYSLNERPLRGEYRTRLLLENPESGAEYEITAAATLVRDSLNPYARTVSAVQVRCTAQRLLVGDYTLTPARLEGQVGYDVHTVRPVSPRNTYELRVNDKVRAVVQRGSLRTGGGTRRQETHLALDESLDAPAAEKLLLTYLVYQFATELGRDFLGY